MPRKAAAAEEDEGPDKSWMESYADAMTLLLAFFIMLFAFALVDETKFFDFKVGMVTALGVSDPVTEKADSLLETGNGIVQALGEAAVSTEDLRNEISQKEGDLAEEGTITAENVEEVRDLLDDKFTELGAAEFVTVDIDERGVVIRYDGAVLFESGSAQLGESSDLVLATSSEVLELVDNPIDVEGHTDDVPTGGQWISNWELSAARASAVTRWLLDFGELPPRRLAAVGLADTRPVAGNDSSDGRARNRRVEIVVRVSGLVESDVDVIDPIPDPIPQNGDEETEEDQTAANDQVGDDEETATDDPAETGNEQEES